MSGAKLSDARTVHDIASAASRAWPVSAAVRVALGDCVLEVATNSEPLRAELADYFKEFLCPERDPNVYIQAYEAPAPELGLAFETKTPDPGKSKIKEEWADLPDGRVVRKRLTGMIFAFGGGVNAAVGPCLANANQVINFVNNRFIERKLNEGCLLGHAAAVLHHGRGLALAGFSGAGKSTLSLQLMSRGTTFISNDRVMLGDGPEGPVLYGVAKQPRINPGTALNNPDLASIVDPADREDFLSLSEGDLWQLEHKYDALIDVCYGPGRFRLQAPMDGLVILNWKRGAGPAEARTVDPRKRSDLLPAFMKSTGLFYLPGENGGGDLGEDAYAAMLAKSALIEIRGGVDFELASEVCMRFLESGELPEREG